MSINIPNYFLDSNQNQKGNNQNRNQNPPPNVNVAGYGQNIMNNNNIQYNPNPNFAMGQQQRMGQQQPQYAGYNMQNFTQMNNMYGNANIHNNQNQNPIQGNNTNQNMSNQNNNNDDGFSIPKYELDPELPKQPKVEVGPTQQHGNDQTNGGNQGNSSYPNLSSGENNQEMNEMQENAQSQNQTDQQQQGWGSYLNGFKKYVSVVSPWANQRTYNNVASVPDGYEIRFTSKGIPYYHKLDKPKDKEDEDEELSDEDDDAGNEWLKSKKPSLFCSLKTLEERYGMGIRLYFDFMILILVFNAIYFAIMLLPIVIDIIFESVFKEEDPDDGIEKPLIWLALKSNVLTFLFSSHWDYHVVVWIWRVANVICILVSIFVVAPVYYFCTRKFFKKRGKKDFEQCIVTVEVDRITENQDVGKFEKFCRQFGSYSLFFVLIAGELIVICALTVANNFSLVTDTVRSEVYKLGVDQFWNTVIMYVYSTVISLAISILNSIWKQICGLLTKFEKHATYTDFRKHHTLKLMLFKLLSIFFMGFCKGFFTLDCIIDVLGTQYMIQLLVDIFVLNSMEVIVPLIKYLIKSKKIEKGPRAIIEKEKIKPEFDVADEYLELVYRQYIIYAGMPSFPFITLFAVLASLVEIILDKARLIYMCKKPPETRGSVKSVVSFFLFVAALAAAFNLGGGSIYVLVGWYWCNTPQDKASLQCGIMGENQKCVNLFNSPIIRDVVVNNSTSII